MNWRINNNNNIIYYYIIISITILLLRPCCDCPSTHTRLYWLQRIESCNMDMLTRDGRRHDQFDALGLYGVFQGAKSKQTRKPGNVAAKNGLKAAIVLDRNGTPLLSVGGNSNKTVRGTI